ncbi:MAG: toll/interleukin-1 receptor domain-containing protein [Candidatus Methanomethylicaceae archaeon]
MQPKKIFISYSHKDEQYKQQIENHLAPLKRDQVVVTWSDTSIPAGGNLDRNISSELESADIILLLVSSDFLASNYCMDIETKRALERQQDGTAATVAVIVRPCDWIQTKLKETKALPKDGKPVASWTNPDEAFLDVVREIKKLLDIIDERKTKISRTTSVAKPVITTHFETWLNDTGVSFENRLRGRIGLADIFVYPDLASAAKESKIVVKSSSLFGNEKLALILGEEQSGKTSLAKQLWRDVTSKGGIAVIIDGSEIHGSDVSSLVENALGKIYDGYSLGDITNHHEKVCILDNFGRCKLNVKAKNNLVRNLKAFFHKIVIFDDEAGRFYVADIEELSDFSIYHILPFNHKRKTELVTRWVELDSTEETSISEVEKRIDNYRQYIEAIVGRNAVPSKPIYLLLALQALQIARPRTTDLSSYGYCYEYFILNALGKAGIDTSLIDSYLNFLTEMALYLLNGHTKGISKDKLNSFLNLYSAKFLSIDFVRAIEQLISSSILINQDGYLRFRYRYLYYFFAGKGLAEQLQKAQEAKNTIRNLIERLHLEEESNIVLFLCHHTKDVWVLEEVILAVMSEFSDQQEATLSAKSLWHLFDIMKDIPQLVLENRDVKLERSKVDDYMDTKGREDKEPEEIRNQIQDDLLVRVNKVLRGVEVCGQILRNRQGSLERQKLELLVEEAMAASLRFLNFFLETTEKLRDDLIDFIQNALSKEPNLATEEMQERATNYFFSLNYQAILGLILRVGFELGSSQAKDIYNSIAERKNTVALKLIQQVITLHFEKRLDPNTLGRLYNELEGNPVCQRVLQNIVLRHCYLNTISFKERQQLSQTLQIPMKIQHRIALLSQNP